MPLYNMDDMLVLPFQHGINEKRKNIQNDKKKASNEQTI